MVTEVKPMEIKKTQQAAGSVPKEVPISSWKPAEFVGGIKEEFQKINWTSPEELKVYTQIVVGATFTFGIGIYVMDLIIQGCLHTLTLAVRLITGT